VVDGSAAESQPSAVNQTTPRTPHKWSVYAIIVGMALTLAWGGAMIWMLLYLLHRL
jgi:hypothetical protein